MLNGRRSTISAGPTRFSIANCPGAKPTGRGNARSSRSNPADTGPLRRTLRQQIPASGHHISLPFSSSSSVSVVSTGAAVGGASADARLRSAGTRPDGAGVGRCGTDGAGVRRRGRRRSSPPARTATRWCRHERGAARRCQCRRDRPAAQHAAARRAAPARGAGGGACEPERRRRRREHEVGPSLQEHHLAPQARPAATAGSAARKPASVVAAPPSAGRRELQFLLARAGTSAGRPTAPFATLIGLRRLGIARRAAARRTSATESGRSSCS